jgi:hypothetical protein
LQLTNDSPAKQRPVPNDNSALTILQICVPMTITSTGLQACNNGLSSLNDVTSPQALSATTATTTATMTQVHAIVTMTQVHAIATATTNAKLLMLELQVSCSFQMTALQSSILSQMMILH